MFIQVRAFFFFICNVFMMKYMFYFQWDYSLRYLSLRHAFLPIYYTSCFFFNHYTALVIDTARLTILERLVYIKMEFNSTRDTLIHHNDHYSNVKYIKLIVVTSLTCNRCLQPADPHFVATFRAKIYQSNAHYL